jgi:ABC-type transport system involved in multi-copper enzyme maturation permease subunit
MTFWAVFWLEWRRLTRRWQFFMARSAFVFLLLAAFAAVWFSSLRDKSAVAPKESAQLGEAFFSVLIVTELTLFLLAAPATTAGAICTDKIQGALFPLLLTNLSAWSILAGKLATRLLPTLGLIIGGVPFLFLVLFFGGIDAETVAASALVIVAVVIFGSALALFLSVWATSTHEVLAAVVLFWVLLLLLEPAWEVVNRYLQFGNARFWLERTNPYALIFNFGPTRGGIVWRDILNFSAAASALSLMLVLVAAGRLRSVVIAQATRVARLSPRQRLARFVRKLLPGPSLSKSPLLWREWYARPRSRWFRLISAGYLALGVLFTLEAIRDALAGGWFSQLGAVIVSASAVFVGLLLVSIAAVTSLAEELSKSGVEIILTTPLEPARLIAAKWLRSFGLIPLVAVLPCINAAVNGWIDQSWVAIPLLLGLIFAYGAALTSWGLFLAVCIRKPGRALVWTISSYIALSLGVVFIVFLSDLRNDMQQMLAAASPLFGGTLVTVDKNKAPTVFQGQATWIVVYAILAVILFAMTGRQMSRRRGALAQ